MAAKLLTSLGFFILLCLSSVRAGIGNLFCQGASDGRCCETRCPEGWIGYKGHCYLFQHATRTFYQAKVDCENSYGSHLVKVDNEAENKWIELQLPTLSNACRYPGAVLFENPDLGKSICYWKTPDTMFGHYTAGQEFCRSTGGDLAFIPDEGTFNFLKLQFSKDVYAGIWIGVQLDDTTDTYVDAGGNTQSYLPWATGQPDGGESKCTFLYRDEFHDLRCNGSPFPALCSLTLDDNKDYWIGATDEKMEGQFQWISDGEGVRFSDFGTEPDETTDENCVMFTDIGGSHSWADEACSSEIGFICEKDADCF